MKKDGVGVSQAVDVSSWGLSDGDTPWCDLSGTSVVFPFPFYFLNTTVAPMH